MDALIAIAPGWLLQSAHTKEPVASSTTPSHPRSTRTAQDRHQRASAYLDKMPASISGQGGHQALWDASIAMVRGFDLTGDEAFDLLLRRFNPRCEPPWSEKEIRHKVADAGRAAHVRRGYLLDAASPSKSSTARTVRQTPAPSVALTAEAPMDSTATILITTNETEIIDAALRALASNSHLNLYQRGGAIVHVIREPDSNSNIWRGPDAPRLVEMPQARLRELMAQTAIWEKDERRRGGEIARVRAHPPSWAVQGVTARGTWPMLRRLEAVVEHPVLRSDGTVLDRPGFDSKTGLLYQPAVAFPAIPTQPRREDVRAAVAALREVVCDFPFETEAHCAAWIAALFTLLARFAFYGPVPLILIDANVRGAGKTLLADLISLVLFARTVARMAPVAEDAEMRKRITSIAMAGDLLVLIDNVAGPLGTPSLDGALTGSTWTDRLLSLNRQWTGPLLTMWIATGNNIVLSGDLSRRCLHVRLLSPDEAPERRAGFRHPNLQAWVLAERQRLVAAALTVLRGYHVAGRPDMRISSWGAFEGWSGLVRSAIVWAGLPDPGDTREELQSVSDYVGAALPDLVHGLDRIVRELGGMFTASDLLAALEREPPAPQHADLRNALVTLCPSAGGALPSARTLGKLLAAHRDRVVEGKAIALASDKKSARGLRWMVRTIRSAADAGAE